jgi:predicted nucleic acid-binding protein
MSVVLADTSGLYALLNDREPYHSQARAFYDSLPRQTELVVIEYILVETMTLLRVRGFSAAAVRFRDAIRQSNVFSLRYSSVELERATFDVFRRYTDKEWSYADCALLASSNELGARAVFSFDHHIDQMGLQRVPS